MNSSGALVPIHAPAATAQREAMVRAFQQAGRCPQEVDFVELHTTGTFRTLAQGLRIDVSYIQVLRKETRPKRIGSVLSLDGMTS